jgi:phosphohistidine phosphatase
MKLYLMRHAIAVPRGSSQFPKDADRPLTLDGREKLRLACQGLKKLKLDWDLIASSPYLRAKQTAAVVAEIFEMGTFIRECQELAPNSTTPDLMALLSTLPAKQSLLLVGHEPALSLHLSYFLAGHDRCRFKIKKAGIFALEFAGHPKLGQATLLWMLAPSQMMRLGKKRRPQK